jgi:hypothetical protein
MNYPFSKHALSKAEQVQSALDNRPARKLVGIYGGWRGLSLKGLLADFSFWARKNTAHKVGNAGALTELLVTLEKLENASNKTLPTNAPRTEFVIVGHSFGGAAVYSAICQMTTERFVETVEKGRPLKPLGDQVILLNPAFEASRHYNLNELAVSISKYPATQRPVLSIFTSEGDWATHYAFPLGRFFAILSQKFRHDKPQRDANLDAVGWFSPFITHRLIYDATAKAGETNHSTFNLQTQRHEPHSREKLRESALNIRAQRSKWHPNGAKPAVYSFDDCRLEPRDAFRPGDPFLLVSVDKKIMKDHDDIDNPVLRNFLREYIHFCQTDPGGDQAESGGR